MKRYKIVTVFVNGHKAEYETDDNPFEESITCVDRTGEIAPHSAFSPCSQVVDYTAIKISIARWYKSAYTCRMEALHMQHTHGTGLRATARDEREAGGRLATVTLPRDIAVRMASLIDYLVEMEECACDEDECTGGCVYGLASALQDGLVNLLFSERRYKIVTVFVNGHKAEYETDDNPFEVYWFPDMASVTLYFEGSKVGTIYRRPNIWEDKTNASR